MAKPQRMWETKVSRKEFSVPCRGHRHAHGCVPAPCRPHPPHSTHLHCAAGCQICMTTASGRRGLGCSSPMTAAKCSWSPSEVGGVGPLRSPSLRSIACRPRSDVSICPCLEARHQFALHIHAEQARAASRCSRASTPSWRQGTCWGVAWLLAGFRSYLTWTRRCSWPRARASCSVSWPSSATSGLHAARECMGVVWVGKCEEGPASFS